VPQRQSDASLSDEPTASDPGAKPSPLRPVSAALARFPELVAASAAAIVIAVIATYRLGAVKQAHYPGHADPAFYFNVAQNIHAGRGMTIDYVWEFLSGQHPLPQYAFGYWLPLPSAMMSVALHVQNNLAGALTLNVAMSVLLAVATYFLARGLTRSPWVPAAAAVLVSVQPAVNHYTVVSEAAIYLGSFAVAAMAVALGARSRPWLWPVAGALAGLANLSRSEGLLLIVVLVLAAAASSPKGRRIAFVGGLVAGYVLVMSPLYVASLRHFGTLLPPASGSFPYITDYRNLYALHVRHSLMALLGGGPVQFVNLRLSTLAVQLNAGFEAMHALDACIILLLFGAGISSRRRQVSSPIRLKHTARTAAGSPWFVPVAFAIAAFAFYLLVAPVVAGAGAVAKGMVSIVPVLVIGGLSVLSRLGMRPATVAATVAILVLAPLNAIAGTIRGSIAVGNGVGTDALALEPLLIAEQLCVGRPVVLMTTAPWEITQATGFRTVQIPSAPLEDILRIARKYGVTDLQYSTSRPALRDIGALDVPGGQLREVSALAGGLYRISATTGAAVC
jgi:hypothetical protein